MILKFSSLSICEPVLLLWLLSRQVDTVLLSLRTRHTAWSLSCQNRWTTIQLLFMCIMLQITDLPLVRWKWLSPHDAHCTDKLPHFAETKSLSLLLFSVILAVLKCIQCTFRHQNMLSRFLTPVLLYRATLKKCVNSRQYSFKVCNKSMQCYLFKGEHIRQRSIWLGESSYE